MSNVGYATLTVIPSAKGFSKALGGEVDAPLKSAGTAGGKTMGGSLVGAVKGLVGPAMVALGGAAMLGFVKGTISEASGLNESLNAITVSYGEVSDEILGLGEKAAKSLGLSNLEFNNLAVQFSAAAKNIAGPGGDVVGTLDDLTHRAADFASVMNLEVADAAALFQSGLAGETEPLRRYGIDLSAATVANYAYANGIAEAGAELTQAQKTQAAYGALMEQTSAAQGDFANTSDQLANQQRILGASWDDIRAKIGAGFLPIMTLAVQALNGIMPALSGVADGIAGFGARMQETITAAGGGVAGFQAVLSGITGAVSAWLAGGGLGAALGAFLDFREGLFNAVIAALPGIVDAVLAATPLILNSFITLVSSAVTALTVAAPQLVDVLVAVVSTLVSTAHTVLPQVVAALATAVPALANGLVAMLGALVEGIGTVLPMVVNAIGSLLPTLIPVLVGMLPSLLTAAIGLFTALVQAVVTIVPQLITTVVAILPGLVTTLLGMLPTLIQAALGLFMGLVQGLVTAIPQVLTALLEALPVIITTLVSMLPGLIEGAIGLFFGLVLGILGVLPDLITTLLTDVLPTLLTTLVTMLPDLITAAVTLFTGIVTGLTENVPKIVQALFDMIPKIVDALVKAVPQLVDAGWRLVQGLIKGIIDNAPKVLKAIGDAITGPLPQFVKDALGIHSPSRVFRGFGRNVSEGMALGIRDGAGLIEDASKVLIPTTPSMPSPGDIAPGGIAGALASVAGGGGGDLYLEQHIRTDADPRLWARGVGSELKDLMAGAR